MRLTASALLIAMMAGPVTTAGAADYPYRHHGYHRAARAHIGECVRTRVHDIGSLVPGADPVIRYTDGVIQSYDTGSLGHSETRLGDPIQLCLVRFTRDCGDSDLPGRTYATGNLRTGAAWTQPDIRSSCAAR